MNIKKICLVVFSVSILLVGCGNTNDSEAQESTENPNVTNTQENVQAQRTAEKIEKMEGAQTLAETDDAYREVAEFVLPMLEASYFRSYSSDKPESGLYYVARQMMLEIKGNTEDSEAVRFELEQYDTRVRSMLVIGENYTDWIPRESSDFLFIPYKNKIVIRNDHLCAGTMRVEITEIAQKDDRYFVEGKNLDFRGYPRQDGEGGEGVFQYAQAIIVRGEDGVLRLEELKRQ